MNILLLIVTLSIFTSCNFNINPEKKELHCLGVDNEKMPIGTKWVLTCNTNPNTKENVWFRNCVETESGSAKWSKDYTEYDPSGC